MENSTEDIKEPSSASTTNKKQKKRKMQSRDITRKHQKFPSHIDFIEQEFKAHPQGMRRTVINHIVLTHLKIFYSQLCTDWQRTDFVKDFPVLMDPKIRKVRYKYEEIIAY